MRRFLCCLAVLTAIVVPASADINNGLFLPGGNGIFETVNAVNGTTIPGWTVTIGSVDWMGTYWQQPPGGGYSVDLDGDSPGAISQSVSLSPGRYVLFFGLAGNPDGLPDTKTVSVSAGGSSGIFQHAKSPSTANMDWTGEALFFTSTGSSTNIAFTSLDDSSPYGPVVGDVSISQVPEASFYSYSAVFGLSGLLMFVRRKRQA